MFASNLDSPVPESLIDITQADISLETPSLEQSPHPLPTKTIGNLPHNRKRKSAALTDAAIDSPTGSQIFDVENIGSISTENLIVTANVHKSANRPRLTVSRLPIFTPVAEGSPYHNIDQIATNRLGFRYTPAGLAEPGCKVPYRSIESGPSGYVRFSWEDRSPLLKVTTDGLGLMGDKGFRSARCNVPIREGKWYMEVKIEQGGGDKLPDSKMKEGAHIRLGWSRREAPLNGPVGLDGYSYAYRDKTGDKVTLSRPKPYGKPFGTGDVIGMYISLPSRRVPRSNDVNDPAHIKRERIAIEFKGQEYFEAVEYPQSKEMIAIMAEPNKSKASVSVQSSSKKSATVKNLPDRGRNSKASPEETPLRPLPTLADSRISFFVNGESQGIAFQDIYDYLQLRVATTLRKNQGKKKHREGAREHKENPFDDGYLGYYPAISLFNGARVLLNSGPDFDFPPPSDIDAFLDGKIEHTKQERTWRPLCERYSEFMAEQWELDAKEELEAQGESMLPMVNASEIEAKAALRREKKRISEQKRRAKKAEEAGRTKAKRQKVPDTVSDAPQQNERFSPTAPSLLEELLDDLSHDQRQSLTPTMGSSVEPEIRGIVSGWNSDEKEDPWTPNHDDNAKASELSNEDEFFLESVMD